MRKLSLLVGALGGTLAGYLFSNKQLREQILKAKDAEQAARLLGRHLSRDGRKLAAEVQEFMQSDDVRKNITLAKKFARQKMTEAKRELSALMDSASRSATRTVKKAAGTVARTGAKAASRVTTKVRKVS